MEVMVAAVIGLITVVVIMQSMAMTESQRRQTSSSNSADSSGAIALQIIQRAILSAGEGMTGNDNLIFGVCSTQVVNASNSAAGLEAIAIPVGSFVPVGIWDADSPPTHLAAGGFDTDTDIIQIIGGGSQFFFGRGISVGTWPSPMNFPHTVDASGWDRTWFPIAGLHSGDLVIVVQQGVPCRISQITGLSNQGQTVAGEAACDAPTVNSASIGAQIKHAGGNFKNFYNNCQQEASVWNGGTVFSGTSGLLYSLGSPERFNMRAFAVRSGRLTGCAPLFQDCTQPANWQVFGDGIVSLKAEYGFDANNNQTVEAGEWTRTAPTANWGRLKALRLVLVARNKQMERDVIATADCAPIWSGYTTVNRDCSGTAAASQIFLSSGADGGNWNRYRYKVFETTVALRNQYWSN